MPIFRSGRVSRGERIAVTLGDPAGIGPEVTLKALWRWRARANVKILLLGKASFYNALAKQLSLKLFFKDIPDLSSWRGGQPFIPCYFTQDLPSKIRRGRSDNKLTTLAVRSIELAARLAMKGEVDAVVTPPINKAGLKKAHFNIPGHTEFLAKLSKTKRFEMMLVGGGLKVVLVTRHMALKEVPGQLSKKRVEEVILLTDAELKKSFGIKKPRLVVCGLNPHAGEEGRFGSEEIKTIAPAVRSCRLKTNSEITGPLSPDALFYQAYEGRYDAEICMYHDQGLIPLKMISRGSGVNVTLGLPFVRTSPDHGTAYDIASRFIADPGSMIESLKLALSLSRNRKKYAGPRRKN